MLSATKSGQPSAINSVRPRKHILSRQINMAEPAEITTESVDQVEHLSLFLEALQPAEVPAHQNPCPICYSPFTNDEGDETDICEQPSGLPCGHIFGRTCILAAFKTAPSCPLCRATYSVGTEIHFIVEVISALFKDCLRSGPVAEVGFTPREQCARVVLLYALLPVIMAVIFTMDVGLRGEADNPWREKRLWAKLWVWLTMPIYAPVIYSFFAWPVFVIYFNRQQIWSGEPSVRREGNSTRSEARSVRRSYHISVPRAENMR